MTTDMSLWIALQDKKGIANDPQPHTTHRTNLGNINQHNLPDNLGGSAGYHGLLGGGEGRMKVTFFVAGEIKGKGRPRFRRMKKFVMTYTPSDTMNYESWLKTCFMQEASKGGWIKADKDVPLKLMVRCLFEIPKSMSKKKRELARYVTKKPDGDNILKLCGDSLNGIAFHDDSQLSEQYISKRYCTHDESVGMHVTLETL